MDPNISTFAGLCLAANGVGTHDANHAFTKESAMSRPVLVTIALCCLAATPAAAATRIVVHNGESLQAAIDAAPAGATIIVKPGVYQGTSAARALTITKDGIQLIGAPRHNQPVILQQAGAQTHGIWVSPADSTDPLN